jgi:hypothetical protein
MVVPAIAIAILIAVCLAIMIGNLALVIRATIVMMVVLIGRDRRGQMSDVMHPPRRRRPREKQGGEGKGDQRAEESQGTVHSLDLQ